MSACDDQICNGAGNKPVQQTVFKVTADVKPGPCRWSWPGMSTFEPFRQFHHVDSTWGHAAARGLLVCALSARIDGSTELR